MSTRADRLASRFSDLAQPVTHTADGPQQTVRIPESLGGEPDGRDRRQESSAIDDGAATPGGRAGWDATHRRVTYWMHLDVIGAVRCAAERNGESVASFVDRALRSEVQRSAPPE